MASEQDNTRTSADSIRKNIEGTQLLSTGDDEGAIVAFTEALELNPGFDGALRNRARAYRNLGREQEAVADLSAAEALDASSKRDAPDSGVVPAGPSTVANEKQGAPQWLFLVVMLPIIFLINLIFDFGFIPAIIIGGVIGAVIGVGLHFLWSQSK